MTQSQPAPDGPSLEESLAKLQEIVQELEEGDLPLAIALEKYEQGMAAVKQSYVVLEQAERRVELLTGLDAAGNPITQPFEAGMSVETKEPGVRKQRTSRGPKRGNSASAPAIDDGDDLI